VNSEYYAVLAYGLSTILWGRTVARRDTFGREYQAIIEKLVEARRARGLTQIDLANALGTDQSRISKLERGERRLDVIDYFRLCYLLELDPREPARGIKFPIRR
jgi:ribosome-binding protein aMBF1 (putative translation factor)